MGGEHRDDGAILVEYGLILVAVLLVSFALVQLIGGSVLAFFQFTIPGFG
jgi:Flp pilus assembly pilin Flp